MRSLGRRGGLDWNVRVICTVLMRHALEDSGRECFAQCLLISMGINFCDLSNRGACAIGSLRHVQGFFGDVNENINLTPAWDFETLI